VWICGYSRCVSSPYPDEKIEIFLLKPIKSRLLCKQALSRDFQRDVK
jgi:hypothetical protein